MPRTVHTDKTTQVHWQAAEKRSFELFLFCPP